MHPELWDRLLDWSVVGGFGKPGYLLRKPTWQEPLPEELQGKRYVVTGANSGIGYATAEALAQKGATVHMLCRNEARGEAARKELVEKTSNPHVLLECVDMSVLSEVRQFADRFADKHRDLEGLIHNAGALLNTREVTPEGHEVTLATHVLGPYLLTERLMKTCPPKRVVSVSSGGMYFGQLHLEDLQFKQRTYNGAMAYAEAKRGMAYIGQLWSVAYPETDFHIMHPGWVNTPGIQKSLPGFSQLSHVILRTPEEGADTIVWLATTEKALPSGKFWCDRKMRPFHRKAQTHSSLSEVEEFWQICGFLTQEKRPFPLKIK